jgi:hypothetical protein
MSAPLNITQLSETQPNEIKPNENLVLEGVPPIPLALAEVGDRYTEFRAASQLASD